MDMNSINYGLVWLGDVTTNRSRKIDVKLCKNNQTSDQKNTLPGYESRPWLPDGTL